MNITPIDGKFQMPELPYAMNALGVISEETLNYHYGKHLKTYIDNLNRLIEESGKQPESLIDIVKNWEGAGFRNNAGQVLNHTMYFLQFGTNHNEPSDFLMKRFERDFGSFEQFKAEFERQATALFGSGWTFLSLDDNDTLHISQEPNAGNPCQKGLRPILTFDVWEHAYYIDYRNRRAEYLHQLWQIIDWQSVERFI